MRLSRNYRHPLCYPGLYCSSGVVTENLNRGRRTELYGHTPTYRGWTCNEDDRSQFERSPESSGILLTRIHPLLELQESYWCSMIFFTLKLEINTMLENVCLTALLRLLSPDRYIAFDPTGSDFPADSWARCSASLRLSCWRSGTVQFVVLFLFSH